jgi:transcriptional regulator with XRE-family HTH domain
LLLIYGGAGVSIYSEGPLQKGRVLVRTVDIGERIAELREELALTQVELAEKARISPSTLSLIESGKVERPHVGTIRKISRALGVEPQELRRAGEHESPKVIAP